MATIRALLLVGLLAFFSISHAQVREIDRGELMYSLTSCQEDRDSGREAVKTLLSDSEKKEFRSRAGIEGLTGEQIRYVGNEQTCQSINSLILSNPELKSLASGYARSYYRAGDYYFVVFSSPQKEHKDMLIVVLRNNFRLAGKMSINAAPSRFKG